MTPAQQAFPTGVGVNRRRAILPARTMGIPHRRGGEPGVEHETGVHRQAFPTGVGVNRGVMQFFSKLSGIPHRRGGEPTYTALAIAQALHSPQAWG